MVEYVTTDACQRTRESLISQIGGINSDVCTQGEDLTDMKIAIARLTIIQETLQEGLSQQIPFWQSELGKRLIWSTFMLVAVVLFVAIGKDSEVVTNLLGE